MHYKKILAGLLACTAIMFSTVTTAAAGTGYGELDTSQVSVRVNGHLVDFEDAEPYIDSNDRTMMPVRFITEDLGAIVSWDEAQQVAKITKNNNIVDVTVGSNILKVSNNGVNSTITMDTEAVLKDDRVYVPIRFVAEAMGAYVDYSDMYNTVGIYQDVLTKTQIEALREYPMENYLENNIFDNRLDTLDTETINKRYGSNRIVFDESREGGGTLEAELLFDALKYRNSFDDPETGFANSREFRYRETTDYLTSIYLLGLERDLLNVCTDPTQMDDVVEDTIDIYVEDAIAQLTYDSDNVMMGFIADTSCVYQTTNLTGETIVIRGILYYMVKNRSKFDWTDEELKLNAENVFTYAPENVYVSCPVDVHYTTFVNSPTKIAAIVALDDQTPIDPYK